MRQCVKCEKENMLLYLCCISRKVRKKFFSFAESDLKFIFPEHMKFDEKK